MSDKTSLSRLTRSLAVGTSVGAVALQVGCAPLPFAGVGEGRPALVVASEAEGDACREALRTRSVASVTALMTSHPASRCIPFILNSLSPAALAAIPASAVAGLAPSVRAQIPAGTGGGQTAEDRSSTALAGNTLARERETGVSGY